MRLPWLAALILCGAAAALGDEGLPGSGAAPVPDADAIMASILDRLPRESLRISGELKAIGRSGEAGRECLVQILLSYGTSPSRVQYTIQDRFGDDIEQLTIVRGREGPPRFFCARGSPLAEVPLPPLDSVIQQTDVTWSDLSLSFLWWRGGRVVRMDEVRGRRCYVIEVAAPPREPSAYASVRLWVDAEFRMLLQAEGLEGEGRTVRRVAVRSFKKIGEQWMIKDVDIESPAAGTRTGLRVLDVATMGGAGE